MCHSLVNRFYYEASMFFQKVMISARVSRDYKTDVYFVKPGKENMNSENCNKLLRTKQLQASKIIFVFYSDGTPTHILINITSQNF